MIEELDPEMGAQRTSAREWLLRAPEVFSVGELALLMDVARTQATTYLQRWKLAKLVQPFGGRSGIFINLVANPRAAEDAGAWERALLKAMPSAMIAGYEILADSGLSTQLTHLRYVIVSNQDAMYDANGAEVHRRPLPWMKRLVREDAIVNNEPGVLAPRLRPGAALADLAVHADHKPDPDDIDYDMLEPEELRLFQRLTKGCDAEIVAVLERIGRPRGPQR